MLLIARLRVTPGTIQRRAACAIRGYAATADSPLPLNNAALVPEKPETRGLTQDPLDDYIDVYQRIFLQPGGFDGLSSLTKLYAEYRSNAGHVLEHVLPYEAYPPSSRRSDAVHAAPRDTVGDGVVLVVHVLQGLDGHIEKMSVCSGFAVAAENRDEASASDIIITCAHTLEEVSLRDGRSAEAEIAPDASTPPRTVRRVATVVLVCHSVRRQTSADRQRPIVSSSLRPRCSIHRPVQAKPPNDVAGDSVPIGGWGKRIQSYVWVAGRTDDYACEESASDEWRRNNRASDQLVGRQGLAEMGKWADARVSVVYRIRGRGK